MRQLRQEVEGMTECINCGTNIEFLKVSWEEEITTDFEIIGGLPRYSDEEDREPIHGTSSYYCPACHFVIAKSGNDAEKFLKGDKR